MSRAVYDVARRWLFDEALPFWSVHGIDCAHGGYVEQLKLDATNPNVDFKRVRVIGRQIYVFSHATLLGRPGAADLARHGYEFLTKHAWMGGDEGWARQLFRDGGIKDSTPDLYDLAFVLFGLGWYYRMANDDEALDFAFRTLNFVETHMRHPSGIGFLHEKPAEPIALQNPHMHLLEAAIVNLETTGDRRFAALADEIVELFSSKLFDSGTGTLAECFDKDWNRLPAGGGCAIEPGHHFEWAWILSSYQRLSGNNVEQHIRNLVEFAETYGIDRDSRSVVNAVRDDGKILDAGLRVWPNTERIQAAVAMLECFGKHPGPVFEETVPVLFKYFFSPAPSGTWIDQTDRAGKSRVDKIPASSLYHVFIAFTELLRVEADVCRAYSTPSALF